MHYYYVFFFFFFFQVFLWKKQKKVYNEQDIKSYFYPNKNISLWLGGFHVNNLSLLREIRQAFVTYFSYHGNMI